jgi:cobalt-zinc-cadmium efflux system outer membrane protein
MFIVLLRALLLSASLTLPLSAELVVVVSLASIGDRIRAQNPDLVAAKLRIQEALGRMNQSGRLANPEIQTSFDQNSRTREGRFEVGVLQSFPITDRLRLQKEISLTELKSSEAEVREVERQLIGQAREAVIKILATRELRDLLHEQAAVSKEFADFLAEAAKRGEGSTVDAGQAKLEAISLSMKIRQLNASETALVGGLKPLLGMRTGEALSVGGSLPISFLPNETVDPSRRPDFQVAKLAAIGAGHSVALEQARRYDDVGVGIFATAERMEDAPDGYQNDTMVGLRLKIALPFWNKNEGAIQEAEAKKSRTEIEANIIERGIHLKAEAARAEMQEWLKMIAEIDNTLLPLADEQTQLTEAVYRNGQGEIQSVLRSREKRLQLAAAKLDALREFHLARVRYETALAKP